VKEEPCLQPQVHLDGIPDTIPSIEENIYDAESDNEDVIKTLSSDNDTTSSKDQHVFPEPTIEEAPSHRTPSPILYDPERSFDENESVLVGDDIDVENSGSDGFDAQCPQRIFSYETPAMERELSPQRTFEFECNSERADSNGNIDISEGIDEGTYGSAIPNSYQQTTHEMPAVKEESSPPRHANVKDGPEMSYDTEVPTYGAESVDDEIAGLVGPIIKRSKPRIKKFKKPRRRGNSSSRVSPECVLIFPGEFYKEKDKETESVDDEIDGLVKQHIKFPPSPSFSGSRKRPSSRR